MTEEIEKMPEPTEEAPKTEDAVSASEEFPVSEAASVEETEGSAGEAEIDEAPSEEIETEAPSEEDSVKEEPPVSAETESEASSEAPVEKPKKRKRGYVRYSPFSLILLAVCAFVFSFSMFGLFEQNLLDAAGSSQKDNLSQIAFPDGNGGAEDGSLTPGTAPDVNKWQEISIWNINANTLPFLRTVNFGSLKAENPDTVAWMYMPSTADVKGFPVNLPVVQSTDNEHYLVRSFDGTYSDNGWVYADYRNNLADLRANRNLIFYGHARSYLIFGGLKYLDQQTRWQQDGYNQFIYVNTPTERTVWQIFSWYETTVDFNYISTSFNNDAEYVDFLRALQDKNQIPVFKEFNFSASDRILTLSTCKGSDVNVRVAVHAVLVRHETLNVDDAPSSDGLPDDPTTDLPATDSSSDSGGLPDAGTVTDSGTDIPPASTDASPVQTDSVPVSSDASSDSGGVTASSSEPPSSGAILPGGDSSDEGTLTDTPLPESSSGGSSDPPSGPIDGGSPSDSGKPPDAEASDGPGTDSGQGPENG